jgi:site-specific recombinase XerD
MHLKFVYNRKNRFKKDGTAPISLYLSYKHDKKYINSNIYIKPEYWDEKAGVVKRNHPNYIQINAVLKRKIADLEEWFYEQKRNKKPINVSKITWDHGINEISYYDFANSIIEKERKYLAPKTIKNFVIAVERFNQFAPNIPLKAVTFEIVDDFEYTLKEAKLHTNTVFRYMKHIRRFMNKAEEKLLISDKDNPFKRKKLKEIKTEPKYLDPELVDVIREAEFPIYQKHLYMIRDMFLFSVYTGLRYSDLVALSKEDIKVNDKGYFINRKMSKTATRKDVSTYIPLYNIFGGEAQKIVDRVVSEDRDTIFPYFTNQHINRELKQIWIRLNIPLEYTFHSARHTCATYLLYKGVNIKIVQRILGHEDLKTTEIYAKVLRKTVDSELDRIEW